MFPLAAATAPSTTDKLRQIPMEFWLKAGGAVVGLILLIVILRKVAKMNKVVLGVIVAVGLSFVGFSWIYERNEPDWATPVVSWLADFFPSKGKKPGT
jgi:apolipoprotein N-acyltransferase